MTHVDLNCLAKLMEEAIETQREVAAEYVELRGMLKDLLDQLDQVDRHIAGVVPRIEIILSKMTGTAPIGEG